MKTLARHLAFVGIGIALCAPGVKSYAADLKVTCTGLGYAQRRVLEHSFDGVDALTVPDPATRTKDTDAALQWANFVNNAFRGPGYKNTQHHMGSISSEIRGNSAQVVSYLIATHTYGPEGAQPEGSTAVVGGTYTDEVVREQGRWVIKRRTLNITSTPSGAEVYDEERVLGRTPLSLPRHRTGTFDISVSLPGYKVEKATGSLKEGQTVNFNLRLKATGAVVFGRPWRFLPKAGMPCMAVSAPARTSRARTTTARPIPRTRSSGRASFSVPIPTTCSASATDATKTTGSARAFRQPFWPTRQAAGRPSCCSAASLAATASISTASTSLARCARATQIP